MMSVFRTVVFLATMHLSFGSTGPTGVAIVARHQSVLDTFIEDHLVLHTESSSVLQCARMCSQDNGCLTFTFTAEDMLGAGSCRGHGQDIMSAHLVPDDKYTSFVVFAVMMAPSSVTLNGPPITLLQLEAEDGVGTNSAQHISVRGNASGSRTLWLEDEGDEVTVPVCLPWRDLLQVMEVRFSVDGPAALVSVRVDSIEVATFSTVPDYSAGHGWNNFTTTTSLPSRSLLLTAGPHIVHVTLAVKDGGSHGVEIDFVVLGFGSVITQEELCCL